MKKLIALAPFSLLAFTACSPAEGLCQKEFDCQEELEVEFEDDYVAVCAAGLEGANNALRKNAEKECEELANAQVALATCESALSCEDLVKSRAAGDDDLCKTFRDGLNEASEAADNGAACNGVVEG